PENRAQSTGANRRSCGPSAILPAPSPILLYPGRLHRRAFEIHLGPRTVNPTSQGRNRERGCVRAANQTLSHDHAKHIGVAYSPCSPGPGAVWIVEYIDTHRVPDAVQ